MLMIERQMFGLTARGMSSRPSKMVDQFVRVDHAGELGADRIYAGQMAVLGERMEIFDPKCCFNIFLIFKVTQKLDQQSSTCGSKK